MEQGAPQLAGLSEHTIPALASSSLQCSLLQGNVRTDHASCVLLAPAALLLCRGTTHCKQRRQQQPCRSSCPRPCRPQAAAARDPTPGWQPCGSDKHDCKQRLQQRTQVCQHSHDNAAAAQHISERVGALCVGGRWLEGGGPAAVPGQLRHTQRACRVHFGGLSLVCVPGAQQEAAQLQLVSHA